MFFKVQAQNYTASRLLIKNKRIMTNEKKITEGLDKELMQLIDTEMNDPVLGKLLNRNAAYVLGKEIKLLFIDKACEWFEEKACCGWIEDVEGKEFIAKFRKAMKRE